MAASTIASVTDGLKAHYKFSSFRHFENEFEVYKREQEEMAKRKTTEQNMEDATKVIDSAISALQDIRWMMKHYDGDPADLTVISDYFKAARDAMLKLKELRVLG